MQDDGRPLSELAALTQDIYERNAARFDAERGKTLFERAWLDRFLGLLSPGAHVLDLGCGTGDPIAAYTSDAGCRVTGMDASGAMLEIARRKAPGGDWRQGDMRTLDLPDRFDGILAWNSFFHLTRDEQRSVLPRLARHLRGPGALMLTVGPSDGEADGHVGDDRVYHASLSFDAYESILAAAGLRVVDFVAEDPACDFHSVLLARRAAD